MSEITATYKTKVRNAEDARNFWYLHSLRQNKIIKHYQPKIFKVLKDQLNSFIQALDDHGYTYAKNNIETIVPFAGVHSVVKSIYHKSAYIESNYVLNYLSRQKKSLEIKRVGMSGQTFGISLDDLAPVIDQYFDLYLLNKSAIPITQYTKKLITTHLIKKIDAGEDLQESIRNFKALAVTWTGREGKADSRARNIAVTETTRAMNFGGLIGAYMSGVDCDKTWVTSDDERVRDRIRHSAPYPHTALDLVVTNLRGPFYNGEYIRFPGDPEASVENTANCRCAMYFEEKAKPKPRVTRSLMNFIIDVIQGFFIGELIGDALIND